MVGNIQVRSAQISSLIETLLDTTKQRRTSKPCTLYQVCCSTKHSLMRFRVVFVKTHQRWRGQVPPSTSINGCNVTRSMSLISSPMVTATCFLTRARRGRLYGIHRVVHGLPTLVDVFSWVHPILYGMLQRFAGSGAARRSYLMSSVAKRISKRERERLAHNERHSPGTSSDTPRDLLDVVHDAEQSRQKGISKYNVFMMLSSMSLLGMTLLLSR